MMANGIDDSGFPVMYIDPVYATVTSKTSNVDFEYVNEEWRESIGNSHTDKLQFNGVISGNLSFIFDCPIMQVS
jgi:hypothetical protein